MRAVIQRVIQASVRVDGRETSAMQKGLLVFVGIEEADDESDVTWLSGKVVQLRIFNDAAGVMNLSVQDVNADVMLISQFTLHAATRKGNRPSYIRAAKPDKAQPLYEKMIAQLEHDLGRPIQKGTFQADMKVSLVNDGPVTIWIDTKNRE